MKKKDIWILVIVLSVLALGLIIDIPIVTPMVKPIRPIVVDFVEGIRGLIEEAKPTPTTQPDVPTKSQDEVCALVYSYLEARASSVSAISIRQLLLTAIGIARPYFTATYQGNAKWQVSALDYGLKDEDWVLNYGGLYNLYEASGAIEPANNEAMALLLHIQRFTVPQAITQQKPVSQPSTPSPLQEPTSALMPAPAPPTNTPYMSENRIESRIAGDFTGWDGDSVYKLQNGQIWHQVGYWYWYRYAYSPKVLVYQTSAGFKMQVEGVNKDILVEQLTDVIESNISGTFTGWSGDTIFQLTNGQIWQQVSYAYTYHYAYRPRVMVYSAVGGYKMHVDGVTQTISVRRLK